MSFHFSLGAGLEVPFYEGIVWKVPGTNFLSFFFWGAGPGLRGTYSMKV